MAPGDALDPVEALATIEGCFSATLAALADSVTPVPGGECVRTRDLPLVFTLNQLRLHRPLGLDELCALADEHQGDLPYRHVVVRAAAVDARQEEELAARGWRVEHEVVMALRERAPGHPDARVTELTEDQMLELTAAWLREELAGLTEEELAQLLEYNRREGRHFAEHRLGILDEAGRPAALTKLRRDVGLSWVEDVFTRPDQRGRGSARALVERAVDLALADGSPLVAIVADADDWPQQLYARLGFQPIARTAIYHRGPIG